MVGAFSLSDKTTLVRLRESLLTDDLFGCSVVGLENDRPLKDISNGNQFILPGHVTGSAERRRR